MNAEQSGYPIPPGVLAIMTRLEQNNRELVAALKVYAPERLVHHPEQCVCFVCSACELWQRVEADL